MYSNTSMNVYVIENFGPIRFRTIFERIGLHVVPASFLIDASHTSLFWRSRQEARDSTVRTIAAYCTEWATTTRRRTNHQSINQSINQSVNHQQIINKNTTPWRACIAASGQAALVPLPKGGKKGRPLTTVAKYALPVTLQVERKSLTSLTLGTAGMEVLKVAKVCTVLSIL
jgi:hypothetical protein